MTREDLLEKRRAGFEKWVVCLGLSVAFDFVECKYFYRETRLAWAAWNAALDSVEIELPDWSNHRGDYAIGYDSAIEDSSRNIQQQGYKVKP